MTRGGVRALFTGLLRRAMTRGAFYNVSLGYCVPCAYPRICSNCAVACFHILGFIARELCDRGDPVDNIKSRACARALFTGLLRYARNDKGEARA